MTRTIASAAVLAVLIALPIAIERNRFAPDVWMGAPTTVRSTIQSTERELPPCNVLPCPSGVGNSAPAPVKPKVKPKDNIYIIDLENEAAKCGREFSGKALQSEASTQRMLCVTRLRFPLQEFK